MRLPFFALLLTFAASASIAQAVYKCEANGIVAYSNEPCINAKVVDTTPTQGLDKSSGVSRKGADVRRLEHRKKIAEAIQPVTGMDAAQLDQAAARRKLPPSSQRECLALDVQLLKQEAAARATPGAEDALFQSRRRYRQLGC